MQVKMAGFTVIEVMLFLAISGLMLVGIFAGSTTMINQSRFTDSMRGLESFLERQFESVTSGVNPRGNLNCNGSAIVSGSTSPGTSNCYLLGRVVAFRSNGNVDVHTVVGSEPSTLPSSNLDIQQTLAAYNPQTLSTIEESYSIPWGAAPKAQAGKRTSDNVTVDAVAFLRSPTSSQIGVYHFDIPESAGPHNLSTRIPLTNSNAINTEASYCIDGRDGFINQYKAAIMFGRVQGSSSIEVDFDLSDGEGATC